MSTSITEDNDWKRVDFHRSIEFFVIGDKVLGRTTLALLHLDGCGGVGVFSREPQWFSTRESPPIFHDVFASERLFLTVTAELRPELGGRLSLFSRDMLLGLTVAMLPVGSISGKNGLLSGDLSC